MIAKFGLSLFVGSARPSKFALTTDARLPGLGFEAYVHAGVKSPTAIELRDQVGKREPSRADGTLGMDAANQCSNVLLRP